MLWTICILYFVCVYIVILILLVLLVRLTEWRHNDFLCIRVSRSFIHHVKEHTHNFFCHERNRPWKNIHLIWKYKRMLCTAILFDVKTIVNKLNNSPFISIDIAIVRCRKNCDNSGEILDTIPVMHFIALKFSLMCSYHREKRIFREEVVCGIFSKKVRASSDRVRRKRTLRSCASLLMCWVSPYYIAIYSISR